MFSSVEKIKEKPLSREEILREEIAEIFKKWNFDIICGKAEIVDELLSRGIVCNIAETSPFSGKEDVAKWLTEHREELKKFLKEIPEIRINKDIATIRTELVNSSIYISGNGAARREISTQVLVLRHLKNKAWKVVFISYAP